MQKISLQTAFTYEHLQFIDKTIRLSVARSVAPLTCNIKLELQKLANKKLQNISRTKNKSTALIRTLIGCIQMKCLQETEGYSHIDGSLSFNEPSAQHRFDLTAAELRVNIPDFLLHSIFEEQSSQTPVEEPPTCFPGENILRIHQTKKELFSLQFSFSQHICIPTKRGANPLIQYSSVICNTMDDVANLCNLER